MNQLGVKGFTFLLRPKIFLEQMHFFFSPIKFSFFFLPRRAESVEYQDVKKYHKRGRDMQKKKRILTSLAETDRSVLLGNINGVIAGHPLSFNYRL